MGQRTTVSVSAKAAFWNLDIESKEELIFPKVIIDFGEILDWAELCSFNWELKDDYRDEKLEWNYNFDIEFEIIFEYLDYKMDEFIQKVVDTRNYYTHYSIDKKEKIFPKHQLPYVNGVLLGVLQYYILKEIGIKDGHIKKVVHQQMAGTSHSYNAIK